MTLNLKLVHIVHISPVQVLALCLLAVAVAGYARARYAPWCRIAGIAPDISPLAARTHNTSTCSAPSGCRFIKVDEYSRTNIENIFAIGDITDRLALTPVALMEGGAVAHTLFNDKPTKPDHVYVPTAVFCQPHMGTCGYTEDGAVKEFKDVDVFTNDFSPMRIGFAGGKMRGYYKVLVDRGSDRVVGMHLIGPDSGEIMQARFDCLCIEGVSACIHFAWLVTSQFGCACLAVDIHMRRTSFLGR